MSDKLSPEEIIEIMKKEFPIEPDYVVTHGTDDAGAYIDVNTYFEELAVEIRNIIPNRFLGCRVTISFYEGK